MSVRSSLVQSIHAECVKIEVDFSVNLDELARTEDGSWYGQVRSHVGRVVELIPLDSPEKLLIGTPLFLTGQTLEEHLLDVKAGTVIDPLGRVMLPLSDADPEDLKKTPAVPRGDEGNFWGLKTLGEFMQLNAGEGVALLGTPSGGFALLFSQIAAAQRADCLYVFCQGGQQDLRRLRRAAERAGVAKRTLILWTPPWATLAIKSMASVSLAFLMNRRRGEGRRLLLIDDLHLWLESIREYGESSEELLLPDGYPHIARRLLGELLDLASPPDEAGNSTSIIAGWRYEEGFSPVVDHPYMARLPRFMKTGIVLAEQAEYLTPSEDSWGTLGPVGRCWRRLHALLEECSEENKPVLEGLSALFGELFVEFSLLSTSAPAKRPVQFTAKDEKALCSIAERSLPPLIDSILKARLDIQLHYREDEDIRRRTFLAWMQQVLASGEGLA